MSKPISVIMVLLTLVFMPEFTAVNAQSKGLKAISLRELEYSLQFLGSTEFRGRETPSHELEIATLFLGSQAEYIGLRSFTNSRLRFLVSLRTISPDISQLQSREDRSLQKRSQI